MKRTGCFPEFSFAGNGGFGLLELLIAMSILAVGILGITKMQMQVGFGNVGSRNQSAAVNLARSKMEELKRVKAYSIQWDVEPDLEHKTSSGLDDWENPDHTDPLFNENQGGTEDRIFTRSWNVRDDYPIVNFKTVRVRVSWTEGGRARFVEMETQIGLKDLQYF